MPDRSANSAEVRADQGPPVQPLIRAGRSWRAIPGHLYGLRQSALIGQLSVAACDDAKLEALDGAIAELLGDPALVLPLEMGGGGIASRFALLVGMAQSQFGHPISDGFHIESARQAADGRHLVGVALPCNHPHSARSALRWAIRSLNHMAEGGFAASSLATPARELEALGTDLRKFSISGINAVHLFQAAHQLDIPVIPHVAGVFRYGTGRHSRLLDSTRTDRTSVIGTHIARNKMATAAVLRQSGLPAPVHQIARSADEATEIANRLGYPVVVKPSDKDGGVGVFAGLRTEESLRAAFNEAAAVTAEIIVERHFEGNDYRLTVQDGCVIKVEQRVAGGVRGDGRATIAELVEREQASAHFQKILRNTGRMALHLDAEAEGLLREQGLDATSVPQKGQRVSLRR